MKDVERQVGNVVDKLGRKKLDQTTRVVQYVQKRGGVSEELAKEVVESFNFWSWLRFGNRAAWEAEMEKRGRRTTIRVEPRDKNVI